MKLIKNHSSLKNEASPGKASDCSWKASSGMSRLMLHSLLCVVAFVLGFRLSGETRLTVISIKPTDFSPFSRGVLQSDNAPKVGAVLHTRKDFTPSDLSQSPPSPGLKSSRVHVGRHEILIRSWPHPDPSQTFIAHRLIKRIQQEQQQHHGLQERKLIVVVTPTYVRALQAVFLSCLIHTLRIAPGPLVWIVVEAGGRSNETAELLSGSKLLYYHLAIPTPMPTDSNRGKQFEIQLRLEGLRFVRNQQLDGVVIFVDDSSTLDLELFDMTQKTNWFGTFSVGLLYHSEVSLISRPSFLHSENSSITPRETKPDSNNGRFGSTNVAGFYTNHGNLLSLKEDLGSRISLPMIGPVCSSEGRVIGWYVPSHGEQDQSWRPRRKDDWAGFALNSRMFWDDTNKPSWIKSWKELLVNNGSLPESPLAFLRNYSHIEPLGDCKRNIMVWLMAIDIPPVCKFPSRWIISPHLEVVVPARRTPWADKILVHSNVLSLSPPPPETPSLSAQLLTNTTLLGKNRVKKSKSKRAKHRSHNVKEDHAGRNAESALARESI